MSEDWIVPYAKDPMPALRRPWNCRSLSHWKEVLYDDSIDGATEESGLRENRTSRLSERTADGGRAAGPTSSDSTVVKRVADDDSGD